MAKNRNKNYRFSGLRTTSSSRNLGPSVSNLGYTYTEVVVCSIAVDRHTYRLLYITRPSQNLKNLKICPERPRGPIIDDLERRNGRNPSDRSIGMPMGAHKTATEDKGDSSWAYLSSYLYHQPCTESQKCRNLPGTTLGSYDRRLCAITTIPNLG